MTSEGCTFTAWKLHAPQTSTRAPDDEGGGERAVARVGAPAQQPARRARTPRAKPPRVAGRSRGCRSRCSSRREDLARRRSRRRRFSSAASRHFARVAAMPPFESTKIPIAATAGRHGRAGREAPAQPPPRGSHAMATPVIASSSSAGGTSRRAGSRSRSRRRSPRRSWRPPPPASGASASRRNRHAQARKTTKLVASL